MNCDVLLAGQLNSKAFDWSRICVVQDESSIFSMFFILYKLFNYYKFMDSKKNISDDIAA